MKINLIIHLGSETLHVEGNPEESLLDLLRNNKVPVHAPCGGNGKCKNCRIEIISPDSGSAHWQTVLACKTRASDQLEIRLPQADQALIQTESYFPAIPLTFHPPRPKMYGFSVDIGTTTVVVFLEDLEHHKQTDYTSFLNPQRSFGADVISRILYCTDRQALEQLTSSIHQAIAQACSELLIKNGVHENQISEITFAGNTTMLHLLAGIDPSSMATYPFDPAFIEEKTLRPDQPFLRINPDLPLTLLPSLSAFVGADILAGVAATDLPDRDDYALFLDIGTNGEMALGNQTTLLCCATAAGPAFEGAKISCGLGGVSGAIHQFHEGQYKTINNAAPIGLCGSGLIDVIAWLLTSKQIGASGYLEKDLEFLPDSKLSLTPQDIREVQLAKGAIAAGIETLMHKAEISPDQISRVFIAGGFGYAINEESAMTIGLLPEAFRNKVIKAGNTAGLGAKLYLHSPDFRDRVKSLARRAQHFDLSADPWFNEQFVMNLNFPEVIA